jgi:hypothetical protein
MSSARSAYELPVADHSRDEGFRRVFVFLDRQGHVEFRLHVWFDWAARKQMVGFQFADSGESGRLVNWRINGHPAFAVYTFSRGMSVYMDSPANWEGAERAEAIPYLRRLLAEGIDQKVKAMVATKLRSFIQERPGARKD